MLADALKFILDIAAYQFLVGGNGDGTWVTNTSGADPLFQSLFRPVGMKSGTIRDTTFFFGGWYSSRSTPRVSPGANGGSNDRPLPGFLSYNATTGVWKNDSSPIPWNGNTDSLGIAAAVPSFGPQG